MNIIKNSHRQIHRLSFRLLISDHGVVINRLLLFLLALPLSTAQRETDPPPPPPPDQFGALEQRFDPSMAVIMVVVVSVFFLMGFFSIYIRRCAQRQVRPNNNTADPFAIFLTVTNRRSRRTAPGLEASVLKTFPTFLYSAVKGHKIGKVSLECAVCLNEFEDDETLRLIPKCSHVFHPDCIDAWLASHTTCPVCRANLVPEAGETISSVSVQLFNPDNPTSQPEQRSDNIEEISQADAEQSERRDVETVDANLINQNTPPAPARSRSTGWRLTNLFPRSHSTGHLSIQPGENCERFTLRLPAEVRSQLIMNSSLIRSQSCVAFPRVRSSRRGFRSGSGSGGGGGLGLPRNYHYYERFNNSFKSDRKETVMGGSTATATTPPPKNLFKSIKSTSNSLLVGRDCDGERSFDRLRRDNQV